MSLEVRFSATGAPTQLGSIRGNVDKAITGCLPDQLSERDFATIRRDCEILSNLIESDSENLNQVLSWAVKGDFSKAAECANACGFTELEFQKRGGGIWLALLVGAAVLLYSQDAK